MECLKEKCPYWHLYKRDHFGNVFPADYDNPPITHMEFSCSRGGLSHRQYDYCHIDEPITDQERPGHASVNRACVQMDPYIRAESIETFSLGYGKNEIVVKCTWNELIQKYTKKELILGGLWYYFDEDFNDTYPHVFSRYQYQIDSFLKRAKENL